MYPVKWVLQVSLSVSPGEQGRVHCLSAWVTLASCILAGHPHGVRVSTGSAYPPWSGEGGRAAPGAHLLWAMARFWGERPVPEVQEWDQVSLQQTAPVESTDGKGT